MSHDIALVELIGYIQERKMSAKDVVPIFKLADLVQLYTDRLIELGVDITGHIHSTDLKNRIVANVPGVSSYKQGLDVMLSFGDDVGHALRDACLNIKKRDADDVRQATLSVAQLLQYNSYVRRSLGSIGSHHSKDRETPLSVYIGMMIHGHTHKRELVHILFHLGLSISDDRFHGHDYCSSSTV